MDEEAEMDALVAAVTHESTRHIGIATHSVRWFALHLLLRDSADAIVALRVALADLEARHIGTVNYSKDVEKYTRSLRAKATPWADGCADLLQKLYEDELYWCDAQSQTQHALESAEQAKQIAERDAVRLAWLERTLFERKWDGTIGRPSSWFMAGPYRHTMHKMHGETLRAAIDSAISAQLSGEEN